MIFLFIILYYLCTILKNYETGLYPVFFFNSFWIEQFSVIETKNLASKIIFNIQELTNLPLHILHFFQLLPHNKKK